MSKLSLSAQVQILRRCTANKLYLGDELDRLGHTYDDLRYRTNPAQPLVKSAPYQTLADYDFHHHEVPVVSFFSGCGGLDLGFEAAGYRHIAAIETQELFCNTLRLNRPGWLVIGPPTSPGDIRNREMIYSQLIDAGVKQGFEGVFYGGPPCQPFSIAANQRFAKWGDNFKRVGFAHGDYGNLLFDFVWQITTFTPRAFLIENVPGLATIDGGEQLTLARTILADAGYFVASPTLLNASDFGVPQNRHRVLVYGVRNRERLEISTPKLPHVPSGKAFDKPVSGVPNHVTRRHEAESILRYMELGLGQRDHLGRVDRLDPYYPSKTVIAGGTKGGGRSHLHPVIPRTLSVRESARLQTFPDDYVFCGPSARQFTQVGNAVPPLMGLKIARSIFETVFT